jgi:hypothetical protein
VRVETLNAKRGNSLDETPTDSSAVLEARRRKRMSARKPPSSAAGFRRVSPISGQVAGVYLEHRSRGASVRCLRWYRSLSRQMSKPCRGVGRTNPEPSIRQTGVTDVRSSMQTRVLVRRSVAPPKPILSGAGSLHAWVVGRTLEAVDVTLLYLDGCPNWRMAEQRVRQALVDLGLPDDTLSLRRVETSEQAEELAFCGSPTILLNGADPFADLTAPVGFACRVYRTEAGLAGAPTLAPLTEALAAAC